MILKKLFSQADARLEGEAGIDSQLIYDLAERVAPTIAVDDYVIKRAKADSDGQHYAVCRGSKVVSSFCVWPSKDLLDQQNRPTGRRKVYADWDDQVIDDFGQIAVDAEQQSTTKFLTKLVIKGVKGVPGSGAYQAFLTAYRRALVEADPSATVTVVGVKAS